MYNLRGKYVKNPRVTRIHKIPYGVCEDAVPLLRRLTRDNHHGEALLYVAEKILGAPTMANKVRAINVEHMRAGYLAEPLWDARYKLQKAIIAQLKRRAGPKGYALVHGAL